VVESTGRSTTHDVAIVDEAGAVSARMPVNMPL
jgi:hypothetical protein